MAEYLTPGVFIEDVPSTAPMEAASTSTGGFVGTAQRGPLNEPVFISSWNAYIEKFAKGMSTPFIADSDLAYAVYGFFQNGGKKCYVIRVAGDSVKAAVCSSSSDSIMINAKDEGAWGNNLKLTVAANADNPSNFDMTISLNGDVVEVFYDLSNTPGDNYWVDYVNDNSEYISAVSGTLKVISDPATFSEGADGDAPGDDDYVSALSMFDPVDDVNLIAIPGQSTDAVHQGLAAYVDNRKDVFGIFDCTENADVESVLAARKKISCSAGEYLFPWIKVSDPLTSGKTRMCPPSGHVMGVVARIITSRGIWKAPAGTEAVVRGAIETATYLSQGDTDRLNPAGIVSILPKANSGIVVWGARSMSTDSSMKYVSDILLDIYIKKTTFNNTQQFVFEPNNELTWNKVRTTIETFLDTLWRDGGLYGSSASEAYYVKCDEDLNTDTIRNQGKMICEVGYASNKPAEFVIFRFSHDVSTQ